MPSSRTSFFDCSIPQVAADRHLLLLTIALGRLRLDHLRGRGSGHHPQQRALAADKGGLGPRGRRGGGEEAVGASAGAAEEDRSGDRKSVV